MAFAKGIAKKLSLAEESVFGEQSAATPKYLRRVASDLSMNKDAYESQEIVDTQQVRDARHGVRRVGGTIAGQLSPGAYSDLFAGMTRGTWTDGVSLTGGTAVDAVIVNDAARTFTAAGADFLTAGFKKGDVIRFSGFTGGGADNNNRNFRVANVSTTTITVFETPAAVAGPGQDDISVEVVGKKIFMPVSGHVFRSYSIEHWYSDISISEVFLGCRVSQAAVSMPATGLVTCQFSVTGANMVAGVSQALASPAGATTDNALAAVNGKLSYGGEDIAAVTGINLQMVADMEANAVVGSNFVPEIFPGTMRVRGSFTALFYGGVLTNNFINENEVELQIFMTSDNTPNAPFISFFIPRVKAMTSTKSDSDRSLVESFTFVGLEKAAGAGAGTAYDQTSISIQDSSL